MKPLVAKIKMEMLLPITSKSREEQKDTKSRTFWGGNSAPKIQSQQCYVLGEENLSNLKEKANCMSRSNH